MTVNNLVLFIAIIALILSLINTAWIIRRVREEEVIYFRDDEDFQKALVELKGKQNAEAP